MSNDTEAEKQHTSAIEPGDVVTLASGGAPWTVLVIVVSSMGPLADIMRTTETGCSRQRVPVVALRKVEPSAPVMDEAGVGIDDVMAVNAIGDSLLRKVEPGPLSPAVDEETLSVLIQVALDWLHRGNHGPPAEVLRRWLNDQPPLPASRAEMDEVTLVDLRVIARAWLREERGKTRMHQQEDMIERVERWLDGQAQEAAPRAARPGLDDETWGVILMVAESIDEQPDGWSADTVQVMRRLLDAQRGAQ